MREKGGRGKRERDASRKSVILIAVKNLLGDQDPSLRSG
jgi:hypothetical protein